MKALTAWATILRDKYGLRPRFVHTDKDMAEIGMSRRVWLAAKHQLCWWHLREALKRRLKGNLPTTAYNGPRAKRQHPFINPEFKPYGRADPRDTEGGVPGEIQEQSATADDMITSFHHENNPHSLRIRIPTLLTPIEAQEPITETDCNSKALMIRIPAPSTVHRISAESSTENDLDEMRNSRHTFCPTEHREDVINMMEQHLCAHPLIPGYSAPTPEAIKAWAVRQAYEFCAHHDLPNLWAYLWENWYREGRWELWARCMNPQEIPRLKTTMFVEAQYVIFL
jgi:hypothetical protein